MPPLEAPEEYRRGEMQGLRSKLFETYFGFDTRSLAAFRIALGLTCWAELCLRFRVIRFRVSEAALTTVPGSAFSWVYRALLQHASLIMIVLCAIAFTALSLGYRTKWAQALTLLGVTSAAGLDALGGKADAAFGSLCVWSLFMPLGERFSVDSVIASLRRREQQSPKELNDRRPIRTPARRFYSLACFATLAQVIAIYLMSLPAWRRGDAELSRAAWVVAALGTVAILSPFARRYTRGFGVVVMPLLHIAVAVFVDLGIATISLLAFYWLLLEDAHWRRIAQTVAGWHKRRVVFVDEDCGFCMWCGRILARLDVLERLEFASNADQDRLPRSISIAQANESITTLEPTTGRVQRGAAAFAALLRSLPFGFLVAIPWELPGLRQIAEPAYMQVANNRLQVSLWMGYGACGLPIPEGTMPDVIDETSPAELFKQRALAIAREVSVLLLMIAMIAAWSFRR
jgi:predicted DCC family thiol-disulfide oxidoreductase YuxK